MIIVLKSSLSKLIRLCRMHAMQGRTTMLFFVSKMTFDGTDNDFNDGTCHSEATKLDRCCATIVVCTCRTYGSRALLN